MNPPEQQPKHFCAAIWRAAEVLEAEVCHHSRAENRSNYVSDLLEPYPSLGLRGNLGT